jgi:hypothetical protein
MLSTSGLLYRAIQSSTMLALRLQFHSSSLFSLTYLRTNLKNQGLVFLLTNLSTSRKHLHYGVRLKPVKSATKLATFHGWLQFYDKTYQFRYDQPSLIWPRVLYRVIIFHAIDLFVFEYFCAGHTEKRFYLPVCSNEYLSTC